MSHAIKRIKREYKSLQKNPTQGILVKPLDTNLFEWHFTIKGVKKTEFEGGRYHGKFILPSEYPFKAPDIIMLNKSGRFEIGKKICLNFTGYHHELWQPSWNIRTMLIALRAFMETTANGIGAMQVDKSQRKVYAKQSIKFVCDKCGTKMKDLFVGDTDDNQSASNSNESNVDKNSDSANDVATTNANQQLIQRNESLENRSSDGLQEEQHVTSVGQDQHEQIDQENIVDNEGSAENMAAAAASDMNPSLTQNQNQSQSLQMEEIRKKQNGILDMISLGLIFIIVAILVKKFAIVFWNQL